jgi:hypothetical protein
VPRTSAIRFALIYLPSLAPTRREPFDEFCGIGEDMWRFSAPGSAYGAGGVPIER